MTFCAMKKCFRCGEEKDRSEFYSHKGMNDGLLGKCKKCVNSDCKKYRDKNIEKIRAYDLSRAKTSKRLSFIKKNSKRWRIENPLKFKAHGAIDSAKRNGSIKKQPCEICGSVKAHAHHDDYSKPLDVKWLCAVHHSQRHKELKVNNGN